MQVNLNEGHLGFIRLCIYYRIVHRSFCIWDHRGLRILFRNTNVFTSFRTWFYSWVIAILICVNLSEYDFFSGLNSFEMHNRNCLYISFYQVEKNTMISSKPLRVIKVLCLMCLFSSEMHKKITKKLKLNDLSLFQCNIQRRNRKPRNWNWRVNSSFEFAVTIHYASET